MSQCREPKVCALLREDNHESLHHAKEVVPSPPPDPLSSSYSSHSLMFYADWFLFLYFLHATMHQPLPYILTIFQQRYRIYEEKQRQIRAAAAKAKEVAAVGKESSHH
ncbi:hypothetical protein C4D60_Mb05t28720 [Musa balbisiana]|uniref:Uncharacterized protein n=1 Tax=Musa balbisiana TaxID=52838 RepID=A0A4S8JZM5_MUSBA|nr:hypothetical protein C4D60_Mb05t28720 [Musa balbisiana]